MHQASAGYKNTGVPTKSDRALEYDVIAGVTARLKSASTSNSSFPSLAEAIDQNRRLWALIAASVADKDNKFPDELKANLFYLFEFTNTQARKILKKEADVTSLIDVNLSVMRGLKPAVQQ